MPRKSTARGRVFPQSFSIDRRIGRLELKSATLFPYLWSNCDDQGRYSGEPEEIKYGVCANIDSITKKDITDILTDLDKNELIKCYETPKGRAIQMLDWWEEHLKIQWAWPSVYPPFNGWQDHLRYKRNKTEVVTVSWPVSGEPPEGSQVNFFSLSGENSGERKFPEIDLAGFTPDPKAVAIWDETLAELQPPHSTRSFYRTWLEKTQGVKINGGTLTVGVPNAFVAEYLENNQRSLIEKALIGITGNKNIKFGFVVVKRREGQDGE